MEKQPIAFGHWPSPLSAEAVAEGALRFGRVQMAGGAIYWSEGRPSESGRAPVLRWSKERGIEELLPTPYSARSRIHEYGGGEFLVAGSKLYFVNDADQDVYEADLLAPGNAETIRRLTHSPLTRLADFTWDGARKRLIVVGESHNPKESNFPRAALWEIAVGAVEEGKQMALLHCGRDFYASPRLSPNGKQLAFLAWDLPAMPWDAAELCVATIAEDGTLAEPVSIAGGQGSACFQPEWGLDGTLYFVWDASGLGQLFHWREASPPQQVTHLEGDLAMPLWSLNASSYGLIGSGRAYLSYVSKGQLGFGIADLLSGTMTPHDNGLTALSTLSAGAGVAAIVGMSDDEPLCIGFDAVKSFERGAGPSIIRKSASLAVEAAYVSRPARIAIPGAQDPIHGLFYPPVNPGAEGVPGEQPPLIVNLHGGPTTASARGLKPRTLFFTSRGFSWLDLDYSGSTGYGRAYRNRLNGNWGVADVDDTIAAARFMAEDGQASPDSIFVTGGSAGGFTVLGAIARSSVFRGASSYYGICDLIALQKTTHKFEQGYQATLLGATLDDGEQIYRERSAINHVEQIHTPLILFQGAADNVVPKEQSIVIAEALRRRGIYVEYYEFPGEGHGFRKAETIRACLEHELAFYQMLMKIGAQPRA